jgi:uncharacterized protein YukE
MYDFVLDINAIKQTTAVLKQGLKHLDNIWRTVENVKTQIRSSWVGQSAEAYVEKLAEQKAEYVKHTDRIRDLVKDLEYIANEAEKMNLLASSFAGYIFNSSISRSNAVVSINKANIQQAIKTCTDLNDQYTRQLSKIKDAAAAGSGLKYARVLSGYELDAIQRKITDNIKRINGLKGALEKYLREMQILEEEVNARFSGAARKTAFGEVVANIAGQVGSAYVNTLSNILLACGISISNTVSDISDIFSPYVKDNYAFNTGFTFNDFIYDQNSGDASQLKMGYFAGDWNGCGWVATYNAGRILGQTYKPADIIKFYDSHGGALVDGAFGVNPLAVDMYLNVHGVKAKIQNMPTKIDVRIEESVVSILLYLHNNGGHYTAIQYKDGAYYAYNNDPAYTTEPQPIPSIEAWLEERKFLVISLITILKEADK